MKRYTHSELEYSREPGLFTAWPSPKPQNTEVVFLVPISQELEYIVKR